MKRRILIAATLIAFLALAGVAYLMHPEWVGSANDEAKVDKAEVNGGDAEKRAAALARNLRITALLSDLGAAQDRIVYGDKAALGAQHRLFVDIAGEFDRADEEHWQTPPDIDDILVYVLSGGESEVLRRFAKSVPPAQHRAPLVQGVLSIVSRNSEDAKTQFEGLNVLALGPRLSGPVSLAKASFLVSTDTAAALAALDEARLLSPHTAIEEASIRRQTPIALRGKDAAKGVQLLAEYGRRYGRSAYAPAFFDTAARALAGNEEFDLAAAVHELADAMNSAEPDVKANVLLVISRALLAKGRLDVARAAAKFALGIATVQPNLYERARLYLAAADAPTEKAGAVKAALADIAEDGLSYEDASIKRAASRIAFEISSPPPDVEKSPKNKSSEAALEPKENKSNSVQARAEAVMERARMALEESNASTLMKKP